MVISPTVGRVVWVRPSKPGVMWLQSKVTDQPFIGFVTHVWNDRLVNIAGFDADGAPYKMASVHLVQEGDPIPPFPYAEWPS